MLPIKDIIPPRRRPLLSTAASIAAAALLPLLWWFGILAGVDLLAVAIDLIYLVVFADNVEDRLGRVRYAVLAATAGLIGVLTAGALDAHARLSLAAAHATVAGVIGGYLALYPTSRILLFVPIPFDMHEVPAIFVAGLFFTLQATAGPTALVAIAAGFVTGLLASVGLKRPLVW